MNIYKYLPGFLLASEISAENTVWKIGKIFITTK